MLDRITVYCADNSHADRPFVVASFSPGDIVFGPHVDQPWQDWREGAEVDDELNDAGQQVAPTARRTGALLDGDAHTSKQRDRWGNNETSLRERFSLSCPICGLSAPARAEKLFPILDGLRRAGVPSISLSGLAPRL